MSVASVEGAVAIDDSEIRPDLRRIGDAFELGQIQRDEDAALMVRVIEDGTYLYTCAEPYAFRLRWKAWAREAIQKVLG